MNETVVADLSLPMHARAVISLLDVYATDIMGGGKALPEFTRTHLIDELLKRENCVVVLTFVDDRPAGLAICFEGFSTFACRPILNIHDLAVSPDYRGRGLSVSLLEKIEAVARSRNCCKLTLEVLEGNQRALGIYKKFGFAGYELDPEMGQAIFCDKSLN